MGRSWRIGSLIGPKLSGTQHHSNMSRISASRMKLMNLLSKISYWVSYSCSCGKRRVGISSGIRKTITLGDSIRVTLVLMLPQIILQVIIVSLPSTRMHSVEIYDETYVCQSDTGIWLLLVGIVFAAMPFLLSLLLNIESVGMPDKFREYDQILTSIVESARNLIITLPMAALVKESTPSVYAYLIAASCLSFVLPLVYNISWSKMSTTATMDDIKRQPSALGGDILLFKKAEDLAITGEMFDTMGQTAKALDVDRDILTLYKAEGGVFVWEIGFNSEEIKSLGPTALEIVVGTLIRSAKRWHSIFLGVYFDKAKDFGEKGDKYTVLPMKICDHALKIFNKSDAKHLLKDRSIIYPGYSFINFLRNSLYDYETPTGQSREEYETELASDFLQETTFQQHHHCRALAMQTEVHKRYGRYEEAIDSLNVMRQYYNPHVHSKIIMKVYTSDSCAVMLSLSTQWLYYLKRVGEAMSLCEFVIEKILPEITETELVSLSNLLIPIARIYKDQGEEKAAIALELYERYIARPLSLLGEKGHPVAMMLSPVMMIILRASASNCSGYDGIKDDISWFLGEKKEYNYNVPELFELGCIRNIDWAMGSMYSEACLLLAKSCHTDEQESLIKEGVRYAKTTEKSINDEDGNIISDIAYSIHLNILAQLESLSSPV